MNLTVEKALQKGHAEITIPKQVILYGTIVIVVFFGIVGIIDPFGFAPISGWLLGEFLSRVYWSFSIGKWRAWAFKNVRNVHELQRRAEQEKLLYKPLSFWDKTEIRSQNQKKTWQELQPKFEQEDVFEDTQNVSKETKIYRSVSRAIFYLCICVFWVVACYFIFSEASASDMRTKLSSFFGGVLLLLGVGYQLTLLFDTRPHIVISDNGLETLESEFHPWGEIKGVSIEKERKPSRKFTDYYLVYYHKKGGVRMQINQLGTSPTKLTNLLNTHRGRYYATNNIK